MSLRETVAPIGPLDALDLWGHPWHGLVKGGALTLPNATTMPYAQPSGSASYQAGATSLIDFGAPAVSTPAEDAAQGMEWRSVAILSGGQGQVYGTATSAGAWIYNGASGARWLVRPNNIENRTLAQVSAQPQLQVVRFGEFPPDGLTTSHLITASLPASWGQSTPVISGNYNGTDWTADETTIRLRLQSVKPDGSEAIFALDYAPPWAPNQPVALGFARLALSGEGVSTIASVSILATREQAAGTRTDTTTSGPSGETHYLIHEVREWEGTLLSPCSVRTVYRRERFAIVTASSYEALASSAPPIQTDFYADGRTGGRERSGYYYTYPANMERSSAGIVLSMYYKPDGSIGQITLDDELTITQSQSGVQLSPIAPTVTRYELTGTGGTVCDATSTLDGTGSYQITFVTTVSATHTLRLKVDGVTVRTRQRDYDSTDTHDLLYANTSATETYTVTSSETYAPGGYSGTETYTTTAPGSWDSSGSAFAPTWALSSGDLLRPGFSSAWRVAGGDTISWRDVPYRYAPSVVGLVEHSPPGQVGNSVADTVVATPSGGKSVTAPAPFATGSQTLYGSHCPVTQEAAVDTEAVCWV